MYTQKHCKTRNRRLFPSEDEECQTSKVTPHRLIIIDAFASMMILSMHSITAVKARQRQALVYPYKPYTRPAATTVKKPATAYDLFGTDSEDDESPSMTS